MGGHRNGWALRRDCIEHSLRTWNAKHEVLRSTALRKLRPRSGFRCGKFSGHLHSALTLRVETGRSARPRARQPDAAHICRVLSHSARAGGCRPRRAHEGARASAIHAPKAQKVPPIRAPSAPGCWHTTADACGRSDAIPQRDNAGKKNARGPWRALGWCLRQESNLYLALRRRPFYPLNYGGVAAIVGRSIRGLRSGSGLRPVRALPMIGP